ncbi:MAG: serine/threonine protein kinase [Myxococcales bacterium]|nr:serine/threonine protein kinase [Myxococcales bacterium]
MTGSVIDKYEVLQKLGEGATATVYRGRHVSIGKDVAIKVLHPHLSASTRYRERFNREARAVGRLSHENIVSIIDYSGQNADECYIVTELVDGYTLLKLIEDGGALPSEFVAALGIELAGALSFAHAAGVIHRDIKPENVMVRRDGVVKLMDFGVARVMDEGQITLDGSLLGSPAYMSPQQAMDETLDGRSDLFSLGTVLFHCVTATVPFSGTNASIILRNIIDNQRAEVLELRPQAAPALAAVIDHLLQTRAEDRYPDAAAVVTALTNVLVESGLTPNHPRINLRAWLVNPKEVESELEAHLRTDLLFRGKARLEGGDTVGALQLFNRLLAIDEDHAEVLALIQALHAPARRRPRVGVVGLLSGLALLAAGLLIWGVYPRDSQGTAAAPPLVAVTPSPPVMSAVQASPPAAPAETDRPAPPKAPVSVPGLTPRGPTDRVAPRSLPGLAATPTPIAQPASVILAWTNAGGKSVDVYVDGSPSGAFRKGPAAEWIGTEKNPISVTAGRHRLELRNDAAEPFVEEFTVAAGEVRRIAVEMVVRSATCIVNTRLPSTCSLTVGGTPYGTIAKINRQFTCPADASTEASFDCGPDRTFTVTIKPQGAGKETMVPELLPDGMFP